MSVAKQDSQFARKMISRTIRLWFVLSIILAAVLFLVYRSEKNTQETIFEANSKRVLHVATQTIHSEMKILRGDVLYLASMSLLQDWLENKKSSIERHINSDLSAFADQRQTYDQIRFIGMDGNESMRINWKSTGSTIVLKKNLQNKSSRYYVKKTLLVSRGKVYVSPFDLNIENNKIEKPIKPMIRVGTPVFDKNGVKRGIFILNYLGSHLLDQLRKIKRENSMQIWLLNAKGFWLLGPRPEMEWGFMYPGRRDIRLNKSDPDVWQMMQSNGQDGQFILNDNLYTYTHIDSMVSRPTNKAKEWVLVTYIPKSMFANSLASSMRNFIIFYILLSCLLAIISWLITHKELLRQKAQNAIRASEARFRALLDSAPDAIVIVNASGYINLVNTQAEKWFGYSRKELTGKPIEKLIPSRYCSNHVHSRNAYISEPIARPMGQGLELFGIRKDGSEFPVEISLSPLRTENGMFVTSIIRDISARKIAEQAKQQIEMRYHELINNLPVGIYRNTPGEDGAFLEINPAMAKMFEAASIEEFLTISVCDLYCNPDERNAFSEKILREGYVTSEELHLKTVKGREFCAAITAVKKMQSDGSIYFDGIVEDITKRKESERQIQRLNDSLRARTIDLEAINHELEAFSYSVSHDLRAPLRAIDGFSHMLINNYASKLDDKGRDRLSRIRAAAQRMALLIDDMLKLSRVSRTELSWKEVDLSAICSAVIEELRQGDPKRNVNFLVEDKLSVSADPQLLRVIMDNLIGNAWKFTSQITDAKIEVGYSLTKCGGYYFVRDNGAGFDMAYADKLFGAFQRLHDSGEFPGTGIGLATVQRIINKHGGSIWAESSVGDGTTFYFTLNHETENES